MEISVYRIVLMAILDKLVHNVEVNVKHVWVIINVLHAIQISI